MSKAVFIWIALIPMMVMAGPKEEAFNAGSSAGASMNQGIFDKIINPTGYDVIPGYDVSTPAVSAEFANGYGSPTGSAANTITNCRNLPSTASADQQAECERILFTVDNAGVRPQFSIGESDSLRTVRDAALTDPEAIAGTISGAYSDCTVVTASTPDETYFEYCDESSSKGEENDCPVVLEIETQSTYTYECNENPNEINTYNCNRILNIEVTQPPDEKNFTEGAQAAYINRMDVCMGMDHYIAWGYYGSSDAYLRVKWWEADHAVKWINQNPGQTYNIYTEYYRGGSVTISGKYWCSGSVCYFNAKCATASNTISNRTVSFPRATITPQNPYISKEYWDNQCSGLEARAQ